MHKNASRPGSGILGFLRAHSTYIVAGHKEPDGDCVGSQLALASYLERRGKKAVLASAGPFTRTEIASFERLFTADPSGVPADGAALVVLDCSSLSRIGELEARLPPGLPVAFVDHHASNESTGASSYVDSSAPAVTCLVQRIIEAEGEAPTKAEAEYLLFGLCTDTGFFRHLDSGTGLIFEEAARLIDAGASPKTAYAWMHGGKPFAARKLLGRLLSRAETRYGGKLVVTSMSLEDQAEFGLVSRDSDALYQLLLSVAGVEAAMVVRQESPTHCTVGLRSRETVDVASIAKAFGGGGHRLASGIHLDGLAAEVVERVAKAFAPTLGV